MATKTATPKTTRKYTRKSPTTAKTPAPEQVVKVDTATGVVEVTLPPVELSAAQRAQILSKVAEADTTPAGTEPAAVKVERKPKESRMRIAAEIVPGVSAIAALTADRLKDLAFISTYESIDPQSTSPRQHGYQREPMEARFSGIARYFTKEGNENLITPIIASVRVYELKDRVRFNFLFNRGDVIKIHEEFGKDVVSIVDGQHRMNGLAMARDRSENFNPDVPVMLLYGLRYLTEAALFDTINTEARRLPKSLIEATNLHTKAGEKTHQQHVREIAFAIAQDGNSVWHGLVNMTGARDTATKVTYEGLRRSTSGMMNEQLINRLTSRGMDPASVAKKFWELVARASDAAWSERGRTVTNSEGETVEEPVKYRLKDLAGVAAVSKLGADILTSALDGSRIEEEFWEVATNFVSKLSAVDWEKGTTTNPWQRFGAGHAGATELYKTLFQWVYLGEAPGMASVPAAA